jgi:hypothetical protein
VEQRLGDVQKFCSWVELCVGLSISNSTQPKEVIWCLEASSAKILQFNLNFWQETLIFGKGILPAVQDARKK